MPYKRERKKSPNDGLREFLSSKNGLRHAVFQTNGNRYIGDWKNNRKHGKGKQIWLSRGQIYEGDWADNKRHGYGILSVRSKNKYKRKYIGSWQNDLPNGEGLMFYSDNEYYSGEFKDGFRDGWGMMHFANGDVYEGEWMQNMPHGKGMYEYANGQWTECNWQNGQKMGKGKHYYPLTGQVLKGFWFNNKCRTGIMEDLNRESSPNSTPFPIPECELLNPYEVLEQATQKYIVYL